MARIEQDNFSSISWHSERNAGMEPDPSGAAASHQEPTTPDFESSRLEARRERNDDLTPGHTGDILECTVSEPHKENDGTKDAYVSYMITTNVCAGPYQLSVAS